MVSTKSENELLYNEVLMICDSYMMTYRKRAEEIAATQSEAKQNEETAKPAETQETAKEPEVDVEAIKEDAYNDGFGEGRRAGYDQGITDGHKRGVNEGYAKAKSEQPEPVVQDTVDSLRTSARYATLLMVLPSLFNPMFMVDPNFKITNHFTESELELLKLLFAPTQPYFSPQFDFTKLDNSELVGALDKAVNDAQLMNVVGQALPMTAGYMMNFGAYGPAFAGNMMGQPMAGQMPVQMPVTNVVASEPAASQQVHHQEPTRASASNDERADPAPQSVEQPASETQEGGASAHADQEEQKRNADAIWNQQDDDEDSEDDHNDLNNQADEHQPETTDAKATEGQEQPATEDAEAAVDGHAPRGHHTKPYHKQHHQNHGYHKQNYNQYNDYNEADYQGYQGGYEAAHHGNDEKNFDDQKRDYYNRPQRATRSRGGNRGGNRGRGRGGKEGRGGKHYTDAKPAAKVEEPKYDEDGFEIISKKTYTKPARRGGRGGRKPAEKN